LKAMTGYSGWPVATIFVQVSSARAAQAKNIAARSTLKQTLLFNISILHARPLPGAITSWIILMPLRVRNRHKGRLA
jgi:hypothetical protein